MKWAESPPLDVLCADGARPFFPCPVVAEEESRPATYDPCGIVGEATNPRLREYLATPPCAKDSLERGAEPWAA